MSNLKDIAQNATLICVSALGLASTTTAAAVSAPLATLAAIGLTIYNSCDTRACEKAIKAVLNDMQAAPEIKSTDLDLANQLLKTHKAQISFKHDTFPNAAKSGAFRGFLLTLLTSGLPTDQKHANACALVRLALEKGLEVCLSQDTFNQTLQQSLLIDIAHEQGASITLLEEIREQIADAGDANERRHREVLEAIQAGRSDTASDKDLAELAAKFGETDPKPRAALVSFLTQKAEEYRSYREIVDNIDDRIASLGNVKAAAKDAAERLDFDEVEALLSRVAEVEAEVFASTQEARAKNALLRNRPNDAFNYFRDAADAFRSISPIEPCNRRQQYGQALFYHGLRYGGPGIPLAIQTLADAVESVPEEGFRLAWAGAKNSIAVALQHQGTRTDGEAGTALLAEAVTAYRDALTVYTKAEHPVQWAMTSQNLAGALQNQGTRTDGEVGTALLAEAVTAYRDALTVRTKADHPVDWAMTTQNLALALQNQGTRTDGETGTALLAEAVTAYRDALTVRTKAEHPVGWATTTQNLAIALGYQGKRTEGEAGTALLAEAVAAYRDALTVRTKADHPVQWAMTQENIAIAERAIANHAATTSTRLHLDAALAHVDNALTVFDPEHLPFNHTKATNLREKILANIAALPK